MVINRINKGVALFFSLMLLCISPNLYGVSDTDPFDTSPGPSTTKEDSVVRQVIKQSFANDPRIITTNIDVETDNGVVSLIGSFGDADEAGAAVEDIAATPGVSDIDVSQVVVATGNDAKFSDLVITSRIKGLYIRDKAFGPNPISIMYIETNDGVVFLTGAVDDPAQRQRAIDLAESISDVKKVIPKITIKGSIQIPISQ